MRKLQEFEMRPKDIVLDRILTTLEHRFMDRGAQDQDTALMPKAVSEEPPHGAEFHEEIEGQPTSKPMSLIITSPRSPLEEGSRSVSYLSILAGFCMGWLIWYAASQWL